MKLHLVTYDCGDYYCEGEHFVGVFSTAVLAEEAKEEHRARVSAAAGDPRYGSWREYTAAPVTVDTVEK